MGLNLDSVIWQWQDHHSETDTRVCAIKVMVICSLLQTWSPALDRPRMCLHRYQSVLVVYAVRRQRSVPALTQRRTQIWPKHQ